MKKQAVILIAVVALSNVHALASWQAQQGEVKVYISETAPNSMAAPKPLVPARILETWKATIVDEGERYMVVQVPAANADSLKADISGQFAARVEIRDDYDVLDFMTAPIDARTPAPAYPKPWSRDAGREDEARDSFVLQFAAPPHPEWLAKLRAAQVTIVDYVPQNGYVVLGSKKALEDVAKSMPVQLLRLHQPIHKIDKQLRLGQEQFVDVAISILAFPETTGAMELLASKRIAELRPMESAGDRSIFRVKVSREALPELAALPAVIWIEPYSPGMPSGEREVHLTAGDSLVSNLGAPPVLKPTVGDYRSWLSFKGVSNYVSATKIALLDTGFDVGSSTDVHADFKNSSNTSFVTVVNYTAHDQAGPNNDCSGHGTMTAGLLAGNAGGPYSSQTKDGAHTGDASFLEGLGMLPSIPIISGRVFCPLKTCNVNYLWDPELWTVIYGDLSRRGVSITSNSWNFSGTGHGGDTSYNVDAQTLDKIVRHTSGTDSGAPMTIFFSAGNNEGGAGANVLAPATAKNVISVGGSENYNLNTYTDPPVDPPANHGIYSDNGNDIWTYSDMGPTPDGRVKPEVVAPATAIESAKTRNTLPCWYGLVGSLIDPNSPIDQQHYWSRGTSFSAPLAAGAGALLYTWYQNKTSKSPSPALMKAMEVGLAYDVNSTKSSGHPPDVHQGWGKVDLSPHQQYAWDDQTPAHVLTPHNTYVQLGPFTIKDTTQPVRVTLTWSDRFGLLGAKKELVNDLDLLVIGTVGSSPPYCVGNDVNKTTGHCNRYFLLGGGNPIYDHTNNVEQVMFSQQDFSQNSFSVYVFGTTIAGDGINQWTGNVQQQDYALFITNVSGN